MKAVTGILIGIALVIMTARPAPAISVELAKKCRGMALQKYPYKPVGTPGKGDAQAEREYYSKCIANGGNMTDSKPNAGEGTGNPPASRPPRQ